MMTETAGVIRSYVEDGRTMRSVTGPKGHYLIALSPNGVSAVSWRSDSLATIQTHETMADAIGSALERAGVEL